MVMADDLFFMAAGFYPNEPVPALLPSHLFLFNHGRSRSLRYRSDFAAPFIVRRFDV
jgi:hypothetical protein